MIKEIFEIPYKKEAEKCGLCFCKSTTLFGLFIDNELVAYTGIIFQKNKAIFKNHYVPDQYRGKGYFKKLLDFSLEVTKDKKIIEATCTKMSLNQYIKSGFKVIKQYKLYTKVRYENIQ